MGVGYPEQIIEAVKRGIDMFDCVIPTREARHGRLYVWSRDYGARSKDKERRSRIHNPLSILHSSFYQTINITNSRYKSDMTPVNNGRLKGYSRAYLHHLFRTGEPLAQRLATINNLEFYLTLMQDLRSAIKKGKA